MEAGYTKDYCVWVDTSNKVASFHSVEKGRPMQFEQHTTFMALPQFSRNARVSVSIMGVTLN